MTQIKVQRSNSQTSTSPQSTGKTETTRYPAAHASSSAFSASANANEDWTKISDLAERRRIQNRIAQRNYRKKLKRRLEDLERKAGSTSASPEMSYAELASSTISNDKSTESSSTLMARMPSAASMTSSSVVSHDQQLSPEIFPIDEPYTNNSARDIQYSYTTPPAYSHQKYHLSDDYFSHDFSFGSIQPVPQFYAEQSVHHDYMHTLPPTLPSMGQMDFIKQEHVDDDYLNPFGLSYATLVGMETLSHAPASCASRSPSSDAWSLDYSRENTPPYFAQPRTPVSRSSSPNVHLFLQSWNL